MKVLSIPFLSGTNPYLQLVNTCLLDLGVEFVSPCNSVADIEKNINPDTIIHLNWPSKLYSDNNYSKMKEKIEKLGKVMEEICIRNGHLVWTVHNIMPHEVNYLDLEVQARELILKYCSAVIVHCEYASQAIINKFGVKNLNIHVIPHPDLSSAYGDVYSRKEARECLNLNQSAFIFLALGNIRAYKGTVELIHAFNKLEKSQLELIIAGEPSNGFDLKEISNLISGNKRIKAYINKLSSEFLVQLYSASNASIHNFTSILTSGSAILSMGLSRVVLAPRLGCLSTLLGNDRGILYEPHNEKSLINAMEYATKIDVDSLGKKGKYYISEFTPQRTSEMIYSVYQSIMQ